MRFIITFLLVSVNLSYRYSSSAIGNPSYEFFSKNKKKEKYKSIKNKR